MSKTSETKLFKLTKKIKISNCLPASVYVKLTFTKDKLDIWSERHHAVWGKTDKHWTINPSWLIRLNFNKCNISSHICQDSERFLKMEGCWLSLTCASPVHWVCFCAQAGGSGVLWQRAERELRCGRAASAVSDTGEGVRVGQAAPLHRPCAEESRLRRRKLVVALVLLVLLV